IRLERQAAVSVAKKSSEITGLTDNKIEKLKEQAAVAEGEKDYVEAEQKYIEMITLNPNSIEIYTQLGDMYMEMRDFKSADETYRYILVLMDKKMKDPKERHVPTGNDTAEINADIAEANIGLEKWDESMRFIEKSITFAPNNPKYLDLLFQISMKVGDFGRADQSLTKLKEVNPENQKLQEFIEQLAQAEK
ncbi:MAG: hypothetical protein FIA99_15110, partial [Ruminiclostridium sp.]|nr:hypothetical protein [Ruminiclostridium sp.]